MVIYNEDESPPSASPPQEIEETREDPLAPLLENLENYTSTIPDALTLHYLHQAGFESVDPCILRIMSVAAQKFIADIANDALVHCKTRTSNTQHSHSAGNKDKKLNKDRKYTLAVEDLTPALADHGICVRKPQYFV